MIKNGIFTLLTLFSFWGFSQKEKSDDLFIKKLNNRVRLDYTSVAMPQNSIESQDPYMGIGSAHYLMDLNKYFYVGTNTHFALFGDQGGLFTLGIEAGVTGNIYKNWFYDASFDFGGGGGYRNIINKGAYINPKAGISYHFKKIHLGLQYSHLNFYTGHIKDNTLSAFVEFPITSYVSSYQQRNKNYKIENVNNTDLPAKKSAFMIKFDQYLPFGSSKKDLEQGFAPLTNTLYLVGVEYQHYIKNNTFVFVHTDAIYKGLVAGYMDIFGGVGFEPIQSKKLNLFTKLAIGSAGGRIMWEGGITLYPSVGIDYAISDKFSLCLHGGYSKAIDDGIFEAYTFGGGIKWNQYSGTQKSTSEDRIISGIKTNGTRVNIQHQTYFDTPRRLKNNLDLHLLALEVKRDLNSYLYVVAQAAFAYESTYHFDDIAGQQGSGGYADGMVGLGVYSPIFAYGKLQAFAEVLGGAGGGAGIDTGEGLFSKLRVGGYYHINDYSSIIASGGKVISPFGGVNSNNVNIGISVNFSTLNTLFK